MSIIVNTSLLVQILKFSGLVLTLFLPLFLFLCHAVFFIENSEARLKHSLGLLFFTWLYLPFYYTKVYLPMKKNSKGLSKMFEYAKKK